MTPEELSAPHDGTRGKLGVADGMTADFYSFDMKFLGETATRIINEVKGMNRVVHDVTSKPPGTIEWERAPIGGDSVGSVVIFAAAVVVPV